MTLFYVVLTLVVKQTTDVVISDLTVWAVIYNAVLAVASYEVIAFGAKGDVMMFHTFSMGATVARMMISLFFFVIYFLLTDAERIEKVSFILTFFLFYFSYTIFEIIGLFSKLRENSSRGN